MEEQISGIVDRITFHNPDNGWSVLKVNVYGEHEPVTVTVNQSKVFAGATMEFKGNWTNHPVYGKQFKAVDALEKKPATVGALEKYIGSGLIHGIGPAIAKRIVKHFGKETLDIFEYEIDRLTEISGISENKLEKIIKTWNDHRAIRNVMMFLQDIGISTLFAVKIYKQYGENAIEVVKNNPYKLSKDIYGIGFFSADRIALNAGLKPDSNERIIAAILHILSAGREKGHCYLVKDQIYEGVKSLLNSDFKDRIDELLTSMESSYDLRTRTITDGENETICYYNKALFYEEQIAANRVKALIKKSIKVDIDKSIKWLRNFDSKQKFPLSDEQFDSVINIVQSKVSILTGGPGCGKTTTTKALVELLKYLNKKILLAAPTGRAAQRMGEVIGREAKTIHRMLVFNPEKGGFQKGEEDQLEADFIIIDESSMLDISLTASLLRAIENDTQLLFIGDVDQLPSVGAGNVLKDLIDSKVIPCFSLTKIFRQAEESMIIKYAHGINKGVTPEIISPFQNPKVWLEKTDCLFIDAEEATQDQLKFISRSKGLLKQVLESKNQSYIAQKDKKGDIKGYKSIEKVEDSYSVSKVAEEEVKYGEENLEAFVFNIPDKFKHVQLNELLQSDRTVEELKSVMKKIHPWSSLNYGYSGSAMVIKLYNEIISKYYGKEAEIQILSPMTKGSLGTWQLNKSIQETYNPSSSDKKELTVGERIFREGDRVIQRRNNYNLNVFNGDIGKIMSIDVSEGTMEVDYSKGKSLDYVVYDKASINEIDLAYAITIHKSQGSEFDVVIIPITSQHYNMLFRNLIYTGLTRGKKLAVFVGTRFALSQSVRNVDNRQRQTMLRELVK